MAVVHDPRAGDEADAEGFCVVAPLANGDVQDGVERVVKTIGCVQWF